MSRKLHPASRRPSFLQWDYWLEERNAPNDLVGLAAAWAGADFPNLPSETANVSRVAITHQSSAAEHCHDDQQSKSAGRKSAPPCSVRATRDLVPSTRN
jgi:hypothetical protein